MLGVQRLGFAVSDALAISSCTSDRGPIHFIFRAGPL